MKNTESLENKKQLEQYLKQIIDREGVNYLTTNAYAIYQELSETENIDQCTARLILITLLAGILHADIQEESALSHYIQKECCLKKSVSDKIADLYLSLLSPENNQEWNRKTGEGFREFCENQQHFDLEAHDVWYYDSVHVDADFTASVDIKVCSIDAVREELKTMLESNPFTTEETIHNYFKQKFDEELSKDFCDYVTCEDYYPPVAEDYDINFEDLASTFCGRYGLKLVLCEEEGETSDYIPN